MKKIYLVALAALTLFSCSKEDNKSSENGETKNVILTIKGIEHAGSKATEGAGSAHETPIKDFTVYFLNAAEGVAETRIVENISSDGSYSFEKVTGLASKIFIVANTKLTTTTLTGSTLTELKANSLAITNYQKGIDNVIMTSTDASALEVGEEETYTATVTIAPIVARLEVTQLEAISANDATISDITEFKVANIYVNNYDSNMPLVGTATGRKPGTSATFTNTDLKDTDINLTSANNIVKLADEKVWAYQLFPGACPTMVIQFASITFANVTTVTSPADELCITVTGFTPNTFAAANIYNVKNIQFSSKNIGKPYEATKNIAVELTVKAWEIKATSVTLQ